ncbi:RidA family protein [Paraburkholderia pallida]|uniref:RidA family protein n=1 Tax=Paraburkholderia pallida TaxID=2547399 RepID=A0A4P7D5Q1_9BURK|nr:RidA family protein [Paraburkholderia pallida]QBR03418.1 RidA family protein [Paraburkholderia pallida]
MIQRFHGTPLLHGAVHHGNTVYLCGATAEDKSAGMGAQTTQALDKVAKWLKHFGSDRTLMLNAMIYTTDMSQIGELNEAWAAWFNGADQPTRAAIGVADLGPGTLIEIVVTAALR